MRTLRLSLVGTAIFSLIAGTAAVMAQTDGAATEMPVAVTGTLEFADPSASGEAVDVAGKDMVAHVWKASDPRLAGVTLGGQLHLYGEPGEDSGEATAGEDGTPYEIANEGGGWVCAGTHPAGPVEARQSANGLVFLGTGEYEGLTAYLLVDWSVEPAAFSGIVFEGEMPPYAPMSG